MIEHTLPRGRKGKLKKFDRHDRKHHKIECAKDGKRRWGACLPIEATQSSSNLKNSTVHGASMNNCKGPTYGSS